MITTAALLQASAAAGPGPYDPARLYATLAFMFAVVGGSVFLVRRRFAGRLIAEIASTLGIFLLVIGTIVYTVAFRGLRPVEVVLAWVLSGGAIAWFVVRLNAIMSRPLTLLEELGVAIRRGDWAALLASDDVAVRASGDGDVRAALREVAALIGETRKTTSAVLAASKDVARIGGTVADGAQQVTESLHGVTGGVGRTREAARNIREAAVQLEQAAGAVHGAAVETRDISGAVGRRAQDGVARAGDAMTAVTDVAQGAHDLAARMRALHDASATIGEITTVVSAIGRQTNLLSLNASIEAARAGDAGRGFAVVAEEVGKLATQSTGSLRRIEDLVREMAERIDDAVERVRRMEGTVTRGERVMKEALGVFRAIEEDARRTLALADAVVDASRRQDELAGVVGGASATVAEAADASAAATDAAARATERQHALTEQLRETARALERSAASLGDVVARFGGSGPA